jgi:hypothetical protein
LISYFCISAANLFENHGYKHKSALKWFPGFKIIWYKISFNFHLITIKVNYVKY